MLYELLLAPIFMYADFQAIQNIFTVSSMQTSFVHVYIKVLKNYIAEEEKKSPLEFERVFFSCSSSSNIDLSFTAKKGQKKKNGT